MKKRVVSLLLIVLLVFSSGCGMLPEILASPEASATASPTATATLSPYEQPSREITPFSEMQYIRPDADAVIARINTLTKELEDGTVSAQTLAASVGEVDKLFSNFVTMHTLARIQSSMDQTDEKWLEEQQYTSLHAPDVQTADDNYITVLYNSPFKEQIETEWDSNYFSDTSDTLLYNDETQPFYAKESELLNEYINTLSVGTVTYNGQEVTYNDISAMEYDEYIDALALWDEVYNPILGNIFVELVKTRNQIAQTLDYENYTDMVFKQADMDYTAQDAQTLVDSIAANLVPIYDEVANSYLPFLVEDDMSYERISAFAGETLSAMDARLGETFKTMNDYKLIDYEPRPGKVPGGFTIYLDDYSSPFVIFSYLNDEQSMRTLIHEFGHFNDDCITKTAITESTDTAEIFSQALELLFSLHYGELFGEETAAELQYNILFDNFSAMIDQAHYTAMEFEIYSLPTEEITLEKINSIAQTTAERFKIKSDISYLDWVSVTHLFQTPFYLISYATSMDIALQLWEIALTDERAAMDVYYTLLAREKSPKFSENIEHAGLRSPFDINETEKIAELMRYHLIDNAPA
ncbi:MAG: M3 family metallopeptidase, partial [Christensenella sp.]